MNTLGEKIRTLRKSKKMTLVDLAGDYMTKGMLSLIENGKNKPSMESLEYIAKQLDTTVSVLLEDGDEVLTNEMYIKIKEHLQKPNFYREKEFKALLDPIINQIKHNRKGAFIFQWYAYTKAINYDHSAFDYLHMAKEIYKDLDDKNALLDVENDVITMHFILNNYQQAFENGVELYKQYKDDYEITDPNAIPRLLLSISAYAYSSYDLENLFIYIKLAEQACLKNKTFRLLPSIYKSFCFGYMLDNNIEMYEQTFNKFEVLKPFLDDDFNYKYDIFTTKLIYHFYRQEDDALLDIINNQHEYLKSENYTEESFEAFNKNIWMLTKGVALYRKGQFDEAILSLNAYQPDIEFRAPVDIAVIAHKETYLALNEERLGNQEKAKEYIQSAMNQIRKIPSNHFTKITEETYQRIMK
ncbi:helix-turn-helix domain-containing protein [Macrococcus animalis]|uniref:helix-turn-helix domain-containing protein n=1 Tax=Macrococcus animalis TaxID=3395467 RepID=UPI0039BDD2E5